MRAMTPRERLKRAIEHREVDRPPIFDKLRNNRVIEHYAGRPLGIGDRETVCKAAARCLDCICNVRGPSVPGSSVTHDGRRVETQVWTTWTEKGVKDERRLLEVMQARIAAPRPSESALRERVRAHVEDWRQLQAWCGKDCLVALNVPGPGIDGLIQTGGLEVFSYMLAEGTGLDRAYYERCTDDAIAFGKLLAEYDLTFFVHTGEDIAFKTGTLVSPAYLREAFFPCLRRVVDFWHEAGYYVQFHSDGDLRAIVPDFLEAGVDALHPLEQLAGMDIPALFADFGHRFTYCGGIDVSQLLPYGRPEDVAAEVRRMIDATGGTSLWIGTTTEVNNEVPLANYRALVDTVRSWRPRR